ncbi:FtsX-like permease family protein [Aurantimonas sp. HBX-1]|nr:FtsX-like permease family protein [Aurantimonas sp. HBX-1]UIJ74016.1 FtsX-like permease family protein [Aurantimonas sp. HBX-1]
MSALDRKLLRDLVRLWAQGMAIALVMACGVMTIIIAIGAHRSLLLTREAYYERYRFAHVFAEANRAPLSLGRAIAEIPGVAFFEMRISRRVLLDMPDMREPASGQVVSLPIRGEPQVNRLLVRKGRLPDAGRTDEVAVNEDFAIAHRLQIGDSFSAILNGRKERLRVTATVLSPEFIYTMGPGDMVPDARRFAILYMPEDVLAPLFDREDAFNNLVLRLMPGASEPAVLMAVDRLLKPYGGMAAYGRQHQMSHAFLDAELEQLAGMARIITPIFLAVSAFLINIVLTRLVALEREQIGLLKALGYFDRTIAWHYAKLVIAISLVGIAIGSAAGTWLGRGMARLYSEFFAFPFLVFQSSPDLYAIAASISVAAALAGAMRAILSVLALDPAISMRPPAPARFRRTVLGRMGLGRPFSKLTVMAFRELLHRPVRAMLTSLGMALGVGLLVTALFTGDSVDFMVETVFFRADRQHASIAFGDPVEPAVMAAVRHLPGVTAAEPYLGVPVILRNGNRSRRLVVTGKPAATTLSRVLGADLEPMQLPADGIVISERVAEVLGLSPGETATVEILTGRQTVAPVRVSAVVRSYLGLAVYMDIDALDRLTGEGPRVGGAQLAVDTSELGPLYAAIKSTPAIASLGLQTLSREKFRQTIDRNISIMTTLYLTLAIIIAFGVIYNSARIQLSERARELASLRVLGFTRMEVSQVLLTELVLVVLIAQPLGWALGAGFAMLVTQGLASDLFQVPLVLETSTFATASLIVLSAAAASALLVRRRIDRLELIRVLKTRE